jgi:hypothetical protein
MILGAYHQVFGDIVAQSDRPIFREADVPWKAQFPTRRIQHVLAQAFPVAVSQIVVVHIVTYHRFPVACGPVGYLAVIALADQVLVDQYLVKGIPAVTLVYEYLPLVFAGEAPAFCIVRKR